VTGNITNGRFETLCGSLLYSRTDRQNACGPIPGADQSGVLLTDGTARDFRDPDSGIGGIDAFPWWAEYGVEYSDGDVTNHFHDFTADSGLAGAGSFGNDYIAGGESNDLLFGQLGNDTIQGDGGVDLAFARMVDNAGETTLSTTVTTKHASASRTPDGCMGSAAAATLVCDYVGDLDLVPSFEAATDGEDYIEGNGGNDVVFGGLGQDDIVGGSSDFFSLGDRLERPDGSDILFGGAGTEVARDADPAYTDGTTAAQQHARDADTIVGDNGRIIRIVGINHVDVGTETKYLTFNYDTYGAMKIVVRGDAAATRDFYLGNISEAAPN